MTQNGINAKSDEWHNANQNAIVKRDKRNRFQEKFWLDFNDDTERDMLYYLEDLKSKKKFAKFMRDAITVLACLRQGRVDTLLQMFPRLQDDLNHYYLHGHAPIRPDPDVTARE